MGSARNSAGCQTRPQKCAAWFARLARTLPRASSVSQDRVSVEDQPHAPRLFVPFRDTKESLGPLRWAIHECKRTGMQIHVVHQASIAVAVQNGPSALVAHQLGNPTWATLYTVACGLGAPAETLTIVASTPEHELIARNWTDGSQIVVGSRAHGRRIRRCFKADAQVMEISPDWTMPAPRRWAEHTSSERPCAGEHERSGAGGGAVRDRSPSLG